MVVLVGAESGVPEGSGEVPVAVVPPTALPADALISGRQVRRGVGVGEILTSADVVDGTGPLARLPDGWRAVPVREGVASGAAPGERVDVASEGLVLVADAIVLERRDGVTLVAVPGDLAATIAFAIAGSSARGSSDGSISTRATSAWWRSRNWRKPRSRSRSSPSSTCRRRSGVISMP